MAQKKIAKSQSVKKSHEQSKKREHRNKARKSRISTISKKVLIMINKNAEVDSIVSTFRSAESEIMKGVSKGVIKAKTASRRVSSLAMKVKAATNQLNPVAM